MSASTEKKNRIAAREAGTDKKLLAVEKEAREKAKKNRKWTIGTIVVVVVLAAALFLNSGFLYTGTTAATIAGEKFSPAEVNYYYANEYWEFTNQYSDYVGMFGLDTSSDIRGLDKQPCLMTETEGATWKDYFADAGLSQLAQTKALTDYAKANGIELTEEEISSAKQEVDMIGSYAVSQGFPNADTFFATRFGSGVNTKVAEKAIKDAILVGKVVSQTQESFDYSDAELEEYYAGLEGSSDMFDYAYYQVMAEATVVEDENGESTEEYSDEALAEAKSTADAILAAYNEAEGEDYTAKLSAAVKTVGEDGEARALENIAGSGLGAFSEWLMGARSAGDAKVIDSGLGDGSYVVVFLNRNDNHYKTAQVRHILIKAEADEEGNYTDEAKAAAKARAEEIYEQWKSGEKTEDSFALLAQLYSEDTGSSADGGLYDSVAQGQMVEEFDKFCFEGHKPGDTAIVYGESGSYAGYHVIFYVGEGELYSNHIAREEMTNADMEAWMIEHTEGYEAVKGFGMKFVG